MQDFKGKARWRRDADDVDGILALDVPLELLGKPICRRSSAHLEAALHFIEVTVLPALCPACHCTGSVSSLVGGSMACHHWLNRLLAPPACLPACITARRAVAFERGTQHLWIAKYGSATPGLLSVPTEEC